MVSYTLKAFPQNHNHFVAGEERALFTFVYGLILRSLRQRDETMNLQAFGFQPFENICFNLRHELRRQGCSGLNKPAGIGFFRLFQQNMSDIYLHCKWTCSMETLSQS